MASRVRMPRCGQPGCGKAIRQCITRPHGTPPCPPQCKGWFHNGSRSHRCGPQEGTTYARPATEAGDD